MWMCCIHYAYILVSYTYVDALYSLWIYPHTYMDVFYRNMDVLLYTRMDVSYTYVDVEYSLWMFHTHMDA